MNAYPYMKKHSYVENDFPVIQLRNHLDVELVIQAANTHKVRLAVKDERNNGNEREGIKVIYGDDFNRIIVIDLM